MGRVLPDCASPRCLSCCSEGTEEDQDCPRGIAKMEKRSFTWMAVRCHPGKVLYAS